MNYELWDIEAGRGLARYRSEDDALALVRTLIERYGVGYADDLELAVEDDGSTVEMLAGAALVARATTTARVGNR